MSKGPTATLHYFDTEQDARTYRHKHGTGGWIFVQEDGGHIILFPPQFPPSRIMSHPTTRGMTGKLIGHG